MTHVHDRYAERMKQVSNLMRDQIESPLDRAIYWIEYVIRHRGAPHLRSSSRELSIYQKGLLDVIFFLSAVFVAILYLAVSLCRYAGSIAMKRRQKSSVIVAPLKKLN